MIAKCIDERCPVDKRRKRTVLDERDKKDRGFERKEIKIESKGKEIWIDKKRFYIIKEE